jgi:glycolate oxidase iron-sulfur subunit
MSISPPSTLPTPSSAAAPQGGDGAATPAQEGNSRPAARAQRFVDYERFLDCVHCGLCLSACPTYLDLGTEMDSPRGRIYMMRGLEDGTLPLSADVARHLDLCLGCRACETACPSGVRYGELIEGARAFIEEHHRRALRDRLRRRLITLVFPRPNLLRQLLLPLRLLELLGMLPLLRRLSRTAAMLPRLDGWARLPRFTPARTGPRYRVGLIEGCVAQVLFAATNRATVRVLGRNGCDVTVPTVQSCCGALYLHAGDRGRTLACARRNIDAFPANLDAIIVNAAGCGATLKEYGALLADDPAYAERARAFSAKVRDITEFLAAIPLAPPTRRIDARVTYHDACHLAHGQGVREAPRAVLRQIPGLQLIELPDADTCCGSAGSYNLTEPALARRFGERKAASIRATGATLVAAANPGCVMQIQGALRRAGLDATVRHPVEVLDEAYEGTEPGSHK